MEQEITFTEQEFIAFALIFMANSDNSIGTKEINHIKTNLGADAYDKMYMVFSDNSDYSRIQLIIRHKELFLTDDTQINAFIKQLEALVSVDNKINPIERFSLNNLLRIIK